jgi:hypothetical protein
MIFTVNLAERQNNHLLVEKIDSLRAAFCYVKTEDFFILKRPVALLQIFLLMTIIWNQAM